MHKLTNFLTIGGLVGATVASGAILSTTRASATAVESHASKASVTVSESCSMTATVNTPHTATLPTGTYSGTYSTGSSTPYASGIGQTTIQTFCNDPAGYKIYAIGFSGDTNGGTYLRNASGDSSTDIITGTATSGSTSNWAMKVSAVANTYTPSILNNFNNFSAVPSDYTAVASFGSSTDATVGSKITTTYAAYIAGDQAAGTYTGKVRYVLVHPSSDGISDADTMQNVATWGSSVKVGEEVTVKDARDNQEYTVARVCINYSDTSGSCADSQLWMTQNLDLKLSPSKTLTSKDTDLNSAVDKNGKALDGYATDETGVISWTPGDTLATPATITNFASGNPSNSVSGWVNSYTAPYQAEGQLDGNDVYTYSSGSTADDTIYTSLAACVNGGHTAKQCAHYKNGNYYNFTAANALNYSGAYNDNYDEMPNSICPAGWRLPEGLTKDDSDTVVMSEFNQLLLAQGVTASTDLKGGTWISYASNGFNRLRSTGQYGDPLYFSRSGYVDGSTLYYSSTGGVYWSGTVNSSGYGYYLYFNSGGLNPAGRYGRYFGRSVRCVAR